MACTDQESQASDLNLLHQHDLSSSSDDGDDDEDDDTLCVASDNDFRPGIDIDAIKLAKKVEHTTAHKVEAQRSILALVADDGYLFAGLEGGDIAVCIGSCVFECNRSHRSPTNFMPNSGLR